MACVTDEPIDMWPDLTVVHGKPRHPQSQGSVERANCDIEDMLRAWLDDHKTTQWSVGLKFVPMKKIYTTKNRTAKMSPYKALFAQDSSIGLKTDFPRDVVVTLRPETEDLQRMLTSTPQAQNRRPATYDGRGTVTLTGNDDAQRTVALTDTDDVRGSVTLTDTDDGQGIVTLTHIDDRRGTVTLTDTNDGRGTVTLTLLRMDKGQ